MTLAEKILEQVRRSPGTTDRELSDAILGKDQPQQRINREANKLANARRIERRHRRDGRIGNYPSGVLTLDPETDSRPAHPDTMSEDWVKRVLSSWLEGDGWKVDVRWGKDHGCDIIAARREERWLIEVKGLGSRQAMRVNYFLAILGEILQRMEDPRARYSICLPDIPQFRRLWARLPRLAKGRLGVDAIFVNADERVQVCD